MTIERRIRITTLIVVLYAVAIVLILFWSSHQVGIGIGAIETTSQIDRSAFMLRVLMRDYLEEGNKRVLGQWEEQKARLGQILKDEKLPEVVDAALLADVKRNFHALNLLYPRLIEMSASTGNTTRSQQGSALKMLTGLMFLQLEQLVHAANDLNNATQNLTLKKRNFVRNLIVALGFLTVIIILVNIHVIRSSVVSPLRMLASGADGVAKGNFDSIPELKGDDEVGKLTRAFNSMVGGLLKQTTDLQNAQADLKLRIEERTVAYETARKQNELLQAVQRAQTQFISLARPEELFQDLLHDLLVLTESEYGFIDEVLPTEDGTPYLRIRSITDISWDEESRKMYQKFADEKGFDFPAIRGLWGAVVRTGKPVIANDPRRSGMPQGHPPVDCFLGLPFHSGGTVIGMAGLANRPGGYNNEIADFLEPYLATCATIIEGHRTEDRRRAAEAKLFETNQRLQAIMRAVPVGISFSEDTACRSVTGNPCLLAQFEITADDNISASAEDSEAAGRLVRYFHKGRELKDTELPLQRAVAENSTIPPTELEIELPSGKRWFADASAAPVRDEQGNVTGGIAVTVDVAERKRTEQEQQTIIEFLRLLNESTGSGDLIRAAIAFFQEISGCDAVGIRLREGCDYPYISALGFTDEHIQRENLLCDCDEKDLPRLDSAGNPVLACLCGKVITGGFDRSQSFVTERGSFWTNSAKDLISSVTEEDLQTRLRGRCITEGYESVALLALGTGNDRWGLLQLNDKRKERFTPEHIALWERFAQHLSVAWAKFKAEEEVRETKDHLEIRVEERTAELQQVNLSLQEEMAVRRRAQQAVAEERQRLYDVLETLPVYVCLLNADYRMPFANRNFRETFGESHGRRCHDFLFNLTEPCEICETFKVMKTRDPHHWYWNGPNGRNYDIYDFPFTDTDGSFLVLEMGIDITERKKAEESLAQSLADLSRSNADLEQFAYVASHDLQEPLRNVTSCMQLLEKGYKDKLGSDADQLIKYAVDSVARMKTLIQDLLAYSRVATRAKPPQLTNCEEILEHTLLNLRSLVKETGAVVTHDPLPKVRADSTQLLLVFQNIIGNALKFRGAAPPQVHVAAVRDRGDWIFSVKDNGIGIESRHLDRIFVIFQRLHRMTSYEGTGMGLAFVKKIVERHRGRIWVESQPGKGSTFYFSIPVEEM
jgi:signal transduction histidine kinase/HAMP domain-containing protein